jgi:hypothetical protein
VARVVRFGGVGGSIDHVIAAGRRPGPVVTVAFEVMHRGRVEKGLRRDAADVGARAAEPASIDDEHARASIAGLVRGRLAGGTGADDDEVVSIHSGPRSVLVGPSSVAGLGSPAHARPAGSRYGRAKGAAGFPGRAADRWRSAS